ncbi:hypothetical protein [Streptomyces millisiae]|uniref:Transcriptional regulator n=1 Tax=Streptomyces millisiae TaxID=3075542 RepID=A0ABU2LV34_9ACTN|nr:hypothetical protein [Streptomyces sp. DSM 44918]MDT0321421.1 hypothetical protein [Streptomyces sp. DSM 44918]
MPHPAPDRRNEALARALAQADITARELARRVNHHLEAAGHSARIDPSGPYAWLRGYTPRSPAVRRATALALTRATGITYHPRRLWPDVADPDEPGHPPLDDLTGPHDLPNVLRLTATWASLTPTEQAAAPPVDGTRLITSALDAATLPLPASPRRRPSSPENVLPPMATHLETQLTDLRRLDDRTGGSAISQRWVTHALTGVIDLIQHARYTPDTGQRLLRTAAGLAQLAGWTAFDGNQPGSAQRFHLFALRLARAADDTDAIANNLGQLAYQAAAAGHTTEALRLATAAVDTARRARPVVRARALGRLATAHAAAGDLHAHRTTADACRALLATARPEDTPEDLYYLTPRQLDAEAGHALVLLATTYPAKRTALLNQATQLLTPLALTTSDGYHRSALLHGVHLAHAHLLDHDRHQAADTLNAIAERLPAVQSFRCRAMVLQLRRNAARRLPTTTRRALDTALSGI